MEEIFAQIRLRNDSKSAWEEKNPVLAKGEAGIVSGGEEHGKIKIGDGSRAWNELPYREDDALEAAKEYADRISEWLPPVNKSNELPVTDVHGDPLDGRKTYLCIAVEPAGSKYPAGVYRRNAGEEPSWEMHSSGAGWVGEFGMQTAVSDALESAKEYADQKVLAIPEWLPPVNTKNELPETDAHGDPLDGRKTYLCKVIETTGYAQLAGVYQRVAGEDPSWTLYSAQVDLVNENELQAAVSAHNENPEAHGGILEQVMNSAQAKFMHCITLSTYPAPGQTRIMFSLLSERNYAYTFYDIAGIMESIRGIIMGGNGPSNCRWLPAAVCVTPMGPTAMEAAAIQYDDALSRLLLNRPNYGGQILWDFNDQMNNQYSFYPDACGSFLM